MPFNEVSEGLFCMIYTPVTLNGKTKYFYVALNDVLLMLVVRWILLKWMDEMSSH